MIGLKATENNEGGKERLYTVGCMFVKDYVNKLVKAYSDLENSMFLNAIGDVIKAGGKFM